ncbi:right-handed parallel beta-helix repeat-containing protein [Flavivirga spongiicola]|uniref:Right-handed parallel beta-helix repeat-containing protein n=1 Tax=Flavivirga spongiicola TaxID=421621 RepID=A0ABU7XXG9_9FLAO|nr:right-handed parallel beta-helix repeat-containing protein [Flavivirga sp. MEBiC05379]MDO5980163.1 right-handed parallel beta-helix repeat-containing protein [Flavivirga sp. MEBiC05379]MDO5981911.1 right-handed parallel beta-helix repeat-containing protein [Flavivirga sp. MEBiC05379]
MKNSKGFLLIILSSFFTIFSCDSNSEELQNELINNDEPRIPPSGPPPGTTYTITNGMTFSQLNTVLASASSGDIVEVEAGTYTISGRLNFRDGVSIKKKTSTTPIFDAQTTSPSEIFEQYIAVNNDNIDIFGIQFRNVRLKFVNANNTKFRYCIFDYGKRKSSTDKSYTSDAYIQLNNCTNIQVRGCVFKRRSGKSGRGIYTSGSTNTSITNNTFGNGGNTGYFVTAINDNSDGTTISGNTIERKASWVSTSETDHGIYAHSFDGLNITDNTISGWPTNASGGAIKARNGQNLTISNNTLSTSGILLYVYSNTPAHPFLKNVVIEGNTINVSSSANDIYHGIGYWRNTPSSSFSEYSIRIANNSLPNGRIKIGTPVVASNFNANNGGVFNNDKGAMTLPSGINNSGNY